MILTKPDVDWSSGLSHTQATQGLLDFFSNHGFFQFVNQSTRFDALGSGNILDVIFVTKFGRFAQDDSACAR